MPATNDNLLPFSQYRSNLRILDLKVAVRIGTSRQEQANHQELQINCILNLRELPEGCLTDNIEDTICYENIIHIIQEFVQHREFQLVEHCGFELLSHLKSCLARTKVTNIALEIFKQPKINKFSGQTAFFISG